ncbi:MAG: hypothetical protein LBG21_07050 [Campylobacteraceae bacterium]|jgi:hypothetical protein|nr:hypothetical protein [Campylobacteraceae bacterium]
MATQLFVKLKGRRGENKVVFTDDENIQKVSFFALPIILPDKIIQFDAERKIEYDEWFYIEIDNEHSTMMDTFVNCSQNTADINTILADDYSKVETIFKIETTEDEKHQIIFQKITNANRIESKTLLLFVGDHPEIVKQDKSIDFSDRVDAYFDGENKIYFRNFSTIRSLFEGIEDYYREATDDEVQRITQNIMLQVNEGINVGVRNRKKIATILSDENIKLDDVNFQNKIREYAKKYPEISIETTQDGKYIINDNKDLEIFLALVGGRYYTSEITGEKMEAKAIEKLRTLTTNGQ